MLRYRLESRLWGASVPARRVARRLARFAATWRHRLLARRTPWREERAAPRIVHPTEPSPTPALASVSIAVSIGVDSANREALAGQTWTAWSDGSDDEAPFHLFVEGDASRLPTTAVETVLLAAVAEDLAAVVSEVVSEDGTEIDRLTLLRAPSLDGSSPNGSDRASAIVGRRVPLGATTGAMNEEAPVEGPPLPRVGPTWRRPDPSSAPAVLRRPARDPAAALAGLAPTADDGRRGACFLLPYLAVGGAERLLFDLLEGLRERYRLLVATLDTHRPELGDAVERCRALGVPVYALGDALPRASRRGALVHLLRHHRIETLVSWNGTVDFFDHVTEWRRVLPDLRIASQLYHHRGGWAARTSPAVARAVDLHLAVNRDLAASLVADRGVPESKVALVHHGVEIPGDGVIEAERARRHELRDALGLPRDAVVAGTFARLHPQKRPLDLVELARRFAGDPDEGAPPVYFLLVGGGPLDAEVEAAAEGVANFVRHPLVPDARPCYAALDLCVMTSEYEGLPVFLLDALARGLPAVAPAVGDIPLLFADGGGFVGGRPGDLDALEVGIRRLLDPATRHEAGERGRRTVAERFDLGTYRRRYESLLFPEEIAP